MLIASLSKMMSVRVFYSKEIMLKLSLLHNYQILTYLYYCKVYKAHNKDHHIMVLRLLKLMNDIPSNLYRVHYQPIQEEKMILFIFIQ